MDKWKVYGRSGRLYDILDFPFEYGRYRRLRPQIFTELSGRILDAGVGTGRNMPFYPEGSEVTGIDVSPAMLERAAERRAKLDRVVELFEMDVRHTSFPDNHFDAVVATFLFCVLNDDQQLPALRELSRVCRPNGEIRLLEYTYSQIPVRRLAMRLWSPWVRMLYGAAFDRETERYIPDAGLELVERRFVLHDIIRMLVLRPRA